MTQRDFIQRAGEMVAFGMDGMKFLEAKPFEALLMNAVFEEAMRTRRVLDNNLAVEIANKVSKLFGD